ncbi:MAG: LUD domain-containing protein [Bacteroidota bacterium]
MEESTSKEKVLKKVRNALINKTDNPYPNVDFDTLVYKEMEESLDVNFAREFTKVAGKFVYCENMEELVSNLSQICSGNQWDEVYCTDPMFQELLDKADIPFSSDEESFHSLRVSVTGCEYLIARLGSIMVSSAQISGRRLNVYPEIHVVIAFSSQLVSDLKQALAGIKQRYSNRIPSLISVITGPSRTADIEKTLVMGAHGPRELFVFLIEDSI